MAAIQGMDKVLKKMMRAAANLEKKIARRAIRRAAKPVQEEIVKRAPRDEGEYAKRSVIGIRALKRSRKNKRNKH